MHEWVGSCVSCGKSEAWRLAGVWGLHSHERRSLPDASWAPRFSGDVCDEWYSWNRGTPKSPILMGFFIITLGYSHFWKPRYDITWFHNVNLFPNEHAHDLTLWLIGKMTTSHGIWAVTYFKTNPIHGYMMLYGCSAMDSDSCRHFQPSSWRPIVVVAKGSSIQAGCNRGSS